MSYIVPPRPPSVEESAWDFAVAKVRGYCGWHIAPSVTEALTRDGSGGPVMVLPTLHMTDLLSITNDGATVTDPEWSASGMVYRGGCARWTPKLRGVVAEITHGYDQWPADLEAVTVDIASSPSMSRVASVTSGSHQVSFESSMNSATLETLDRYRLPFVQ